MGTGKSVTAGLLSQKLDMGLICLDDVIEKEAGKSINDIFAQDGETRFRELERDAVEKACLKNNVVVDAGGGAIINEANYNNFKKSGMIFCLTASVDEIIKRTKPQIHRPLLNVDNPKAKIQELLDKRAQFYNTADYMIDTTGLSVEEVAEEITSLLSFPRKRESS